MTEICMKSITKYGDVKLRPPGMCRWGRGMEGEGEGVKGKG